MTLRIPAKVLLHVWSYDFYDMTLSTGKQRRHMINAILKVFPIQMHRRPMLTLSKIGQGHHSVMIYMHTCT